MENRYYKDITGMEQLVQTYWEEEAYKAQNKNNTPNWIEDFDPEKGEFYVK